MEKEHKPDGFGEIEETIRGEKDRALKAFRKGNFSARLEAKIRQIGEGGAPRIVWFRKPAPSLLGAFFLLAAGVLVINRIFDKPPAKGENIFEVYLRQVSGFQGFAYDKTTPGMILENRDTSLAPLSDKMIKLFEQARKEQRSASDLRPSDSGTKPTPRLTLKERMEILFREQAIHRFFNLYHEKNKEVWKWSVNFSLYLV